MQSKPRKPGGAFRVFALALTSCLVLAAAAASSASALSFKPANTPKFTLSGGAIGARTGSGDEKYVWCEGGTTGSATMEDEASGMATLEFHGCKGMKSPILNASCTTSGAASGTIVTKPLAVHLAELPEDEIAMVFDSIESESSFAVFSCGTAKVRWRGSVIGEITTPEYSKSSSTLTVAFETSEGKQEYTETVEGQETYLEASVNEGAYFDIGIDGDVTMTAVEGGKFELSPKEPEKGEYPYLAHPGGLPAATEWVGPEVTLRYGSHVTCTGFALTGAGEFVKVGNKTQGTAEITFHNCATVFGIPCTSAGQSTGTVKTEPLPIMLYYLSDGSPGILFAQNSSSGKVMEMSCSFAGKVVVTGSVAGSIAEYGAYGLSLLEADVNVVEEGGKFVQEYSEPGFGLQVSKNGGKAEPATLDMLAIVTLAGGGVELRENKPF